MMLLLHDLILLLCIDLVMLVAYPIGITELSAVGIIAHIAMTCASVLGCCLLGAIYK